MLLIAGTGGHGVGALGAFGDVAVGRHHQLDVLAGLEFDLLVFQGEVEFLDVVGEILETLDLGLELFDGEELLGQLDF